MKTIPQVLQDRLNKHVTTLCTCWKITLRDGTVLCFTDHDKDLVIDGLTYKATVGFEASAVSTDADLRPDVLDVRAILLQDDAITEEDIVAGRYDGAMIEIFMVDYTNASLGKIWLRRGWIGEITVADDRFVAELRGIIDRLGQSTLGEVYSPTCRAQLGDSRCKINLNDYRVTGTITDVTDRKTFADVNNNADDGWFNFGKIRFLTGANAGIEREIKRWIQNNHTFELYLPMPYTVEVGDEYEAFPGCDKSFSTCKNKFNNVVNFRGEPYVPGRDKILKYVSHPGDV
ncbi:MAG: hypothetical protein DRN81_05585 [Thermoproteota archaeon]|nr:MAG: hypothetical protein DRN81_05585 [Candidatus Korarchaeota archaeon]